MTLERKLSKDGAAIVDNYEDAHVAVHIRNLKKCYREEIPVVENLSMTVKKGSIYTLLGSSSSGKTTLISLILGLRQFDSGELFVFGKRLGTIGSKIPGKKLGYMPQELALYDNLTIKEVIQFYSRIYGMNKNETKEKWDFLKNLLQLPKGFQVIKSLSGGQQRRASLALALLHSPELLVLDEPTVGLDPLIRCNIWEYLRRISSSMNTTVLLTTHFIEEARVAVDQEKMIKFSTIKPFDSNSILSEGQQKPEESQHNADYKVWEILKWSDICKFGVHVYGMSAIMMLTFFRFPWFLAFMLLMPAIQGSITATVLGSKMSAMHFGIVNLEMPNWKEDCISSLHTSNLCNLSILSCVYLSQLESNNFFVLDSYNSENDALKNVQSGKSWGYLVFPQNFSANSVDVAFSGYFASNESLDRYQIHIHLDYSRKTYATMLATVSELTLAISTWCILESLASFFIIQHLFESFWRYTNQLSLSCGLGKFEFPIQFRNSVYETSENGYIEYVLPGIINFTVFSLVSCLTAMMFINDFKSGTLIRARVAGLSITEMICSHLITQSILTAVQVLLWCGVLRYIFDVPIRGPFFLFVVFCLICGICGAATGILFAIFSREELYLLWLCVFLAPVFLLFGGLTYPTELMPKFWQTFGMFLPTNLPTKSLRSIMVRGLGLTHPLVWPGYAFIVTWTVGVSIISVLLFNRVCKKL